ncbi:hypothetical protein GIB67_006871 [Kingdonia uniflora]|uniref:Uncharacterized protein n=1 Tax=Kingdonia uniflora TaxID=39325 RepID=A0A7J7L052_9MAGN|nr:hypothetical protein GIB67_006871 [Kingdonia uniflora]
MCLEMASSPKISIAPLTIDGSIYLPWKSELKAHLSSMNLARIVATPDAPSPYMLKPRNPAVMYGSVVLPSDKAKALVFMSDHLSDMP